MKNDVLSRISAIALACAVPALMLAGIEVAAAQSTDEVVTPNGVAQKLELTTAQRSAIYQAVSKDKAKVAPSRFATAVGGEVPPMIELYMLPDDILATNPVTKFYKYTVVQDQVVLVDPTNMRAIAVIGPKRSQ
jgi:Protein of unknown function (DUF1236)